MRRGAHIIRASFVVLLLGMAIPLVWMGSAAADPVKVYTADLDFDEGTLTGVEHTTVHDQLQLCAVTEPLPFIWVPNEGQGTISRVSTDTGKELGRYRVSGKSGTSSPSRTTVDLDGNAWVGNRDTGTVVKVGMPELGEGVGWIDRNHNGVCDTSRDLNNDGNITGAELLPWGDDECVLYEVSLVPGHKGVYTPGTYPTAWYDTGHWSTSPRGIAIDADNHLWAGSWAPPGVGHAQYHEIGLDGGGNMAILNTVDCPGHSAYGAVIDENGTLWSSGWSSNTLATIDTNTLSFSKQYMGGQWTYGLGLDYLDHVWSSSFYYDRLRKIDISDTIPPYTMTTYTRPEFTQARGVAVTSADNNIWVADTGQNCVFRYNQSGTLVATVTDALLRGPTGVAVDNNGKVWVTDLSNNYIHRINPATNSVDLSKEIIGAGGHYTYSDMTGIIARSITTRLGTWEVMLDTGVLNAEWQEIWWDADVPQGTSLQVQTQSSNDSSSWSSWVLATSGGAVPSPDARYLNIKATFQVTSGDVSPVLYDLSVKWTTGAVIIPEPCSIALLGGGLAVLALRRRRRAAR